MGQVQKEWKGRAHKGNAHKGSLYKTRKVGEAWLGKMPNSRQGGVGYSE